MQSDNLVTIIDNVENSWEEGFSYIVDFINPVLRSFDIPQIETVRSCDLTFVQIRQRFLNSISGLRPIFNDIGSEPNLSPWSFGFVNGRNNDEFLVGQPPYQTDQDLRGLLEFLLPNHEKRFWRICIKDRIVEHAENWRSVVDKWRSDLVIEKAVEQDIADYSDAKSPAYWRKVFDLSWRTIKKRIDEGQIRAIRLSTKSYRIHKEDVPSGN